MISAMCLKDVCCDLSSIPGSSILDAFLGYLIYSIVKNGVLCVITVINFLKRTSLKKENETWRSVRPESTIVKSLSDI
jgi:hypothetical protein